MRRQTIYLIGILLVLFLAIQCVANAEEKPVDSKGTWVLLYKYPTNDGGLASYIIDANIQNITRCWEVGKLTVAQVYHRDASYECVSKIDFLAREYEQRVIDFDKRED